MPDGSMPQLLGGELDSASLGQLFDDLTSCADIDRVQVRSREGGRKDDRLTTLLEARDLIGGGCVSMVQIRYRYQDEVWCDTLLVRDGRVRLVRVKQEFDDRDGSPVPAPDSC